MTEQTVDPFDDPDRAVQIEDDDPESLAGEACEFDPDDDGDGDDQADEHDRGA